MASTSLVLHRGARLVERAQLDQIEAPPPTATWFPLKHSSVLDTAIEALGQAGFAVRRAQLALSANDTRFFATLDLDCPLVAGVSLAVGMRNSVDRSLAQGFCAGNRVFTCDNLSFRSELIVHRKHTKFGQQRFAEALCQAVGSLGQFRAKEEERIRRFQVAELAPETAEALILRSYERGLVSHYVLPKLIAAWRKPDREEFAPRTLWSLENCFTGALTPLQRSNPQRFAALTIRLEDLLLEALPAPAEAPAVMAV